jgi:hypothetical protein
MDPASALSLAVNILAIVQLTGKIIHAAIEIRGYVSGLTEDDQNLEIMIKIWKGSRQNYLNRWQRKTQTKTGLPSSSWVPEDIW